ncbi:MULTISPECIES: MFS transporter [Rahnella]|jgi:MFS family permease|uniref:MFS transporter n=1 Tax=Rahnella sp. (strain Y9602) TaxID=2703885 RepID=A0ABW6C9B5_RAHSY|nr:MULTISPECIES: MFS transporter [Rahnella]AFE59868.1 major facilitator superfamily protein [Rahnella aquatilis HX2]AYA08538.1 MFS transporter [Rahnella aquatilis]AZP43636.1 MFS transporter [Rahnella aquatilis]AZP47973.1 MFS transporter [Rahnella aquatilis]AZP52423.1 MFS transporter [Rahnella aquatilis]
MTSSSSGSLQVLFTVCLAAVILPLNFVSGAVATPAIARELGGSAQALSWITNSFMLTFGCFLMAAGALADELGRKKVFVSGVSLFALLSLLQAFSSSLLWIDLLRAAQGIAAAGALAGGAAALAQEFDGAARTRAFSLMGSSFGVGLAFGPFLAGVLIANFGWRSVFFSATVIAVLSLITGAGKMRETRNPQASGIDWPGTLSFTAMLALLTWALMEIPQSGLHSTRVLSLLGGAALLLAVFVVVELRVKNPMLDLSLFRYIRFIGVQALPLATGFCFVVLLVVLPMLFIGVSGLSEERAGLMMMALSVPMLIVPLLAAWLTRWISAGVLCTSGLVIAAAGLGWLSQAVLAQDVTGMIAPMVVVGIGTGLPWGLMDGLSVSVVPKERAGMATGIFSTTRVAGEGISLAIVGAILSMLTHNALAARFTGDAISPEAISQAAQRLATGNLTVAQQLITQASTAQLQQLYAVSLHPLLLCLMAITLFSALLVLLALRGKHQ